MSKPTEHKTVQARILAYAQEVGWTLVSRDEAERRRGLNRRERREHKEEFDSESLSSLCSLRLFFEELLDAKVREFNPRYAEAEGALLGKFRHLHSDIYGNREFVEHLRNRGKFRDHEEKRERDLMLIDYDKPENNIPAA
ncbi:MAG: type I restriction endonuclease [Luteolibacter sp.]